jgi:hypothetical protein
MNAKGNFGMVCEEMHGMQSPGAGDHQTCRTKHAFLERTEYSLINRMTHPEIIGVDNQ